LGESSPIFRGQKPETLAYNGVYGFFSQPKLRYAQRKIREIVTGLYRVGASLTVFNGQVLVWVASSPKCFYGLKYDNFTIAPVGTFRFVFLILSSKPANEHRGNYWDMSHRGFSITHVLIFGGPSPIFYRWGNRQFSAQLSTTFRLGGLLVHNY